jgi:aminoglycoside phosphotransferase family enzyme/predicted kinase
VSASVRETHVGVVMLVGSRAYKVKKPVRTAFLDFTTAERRRATLLRELELNRRLAPDAYLGVAELSDPTGGEGSEPVLVMRRMPDDRRLAALVGGGADVQDDVRAVARLLAAFHARADRSPVISADGDATALTARWTANLAELAPYRGRVLDAEVVDGIGDRVHRFLAGRGPLLADRVARRRVVDGHGDLIAEDVFCLDDGPRVLDCLEFDDRLRHVDGLDDAAFLAMDLEHLGRPDLAEQFLDDYAEFSADPAPTALRHHYIAYRAVVRAKVACLRHDQGDPDAARDAAAHAELALRHLVDGEVRLVLVGGLPGTGKTTLARGLADRFGAVVLSTDRLRKELAGVDPQARVSAGYREGLYSPARTEQVHTELLRRAGLLLGRGETVILDASWSRAAHRARAAALGRECAAPLLELRCETAAAEAQQRILTRVGGPSDATPAIAAAMAEAADPWPDAATVTTGGGAGATLERAAALWTGTGALWTGTGALWTGTGRDRIEPGGTGPG